MQARLRQGHRQEALSVYREYAWTLIREMGAPPAERMRALADQAATLVKQTR